MLLRSTLGKVGLGAVMAGLGWAAGSSSAADLTGLWTFDHPADLAGATLGSDLTFEGAAPTYAASRADDASTSLTGVITTAAAIEANRIRVDHGIAANGGGSYVNRYTILVDLFSPVESRYAWRAIYQTSMGNANDGDYFIRDDNGALGVGDLGYSSTPIDETAWTRLVITVDLSLAGNDVLAYLDGTLHYTHPFDQDVDGRFSLDPYFYFSTDDNGENAPLHVGALAVYDGVLTPGEVAALGVAGDPIGPPDPGDPPVLTVQPAGPATATAGIAEGFDFLATDPNGDDVQVQVDWGNGVTSAWTASGPSGVTRTLSYAYPVSGSFTIRARARDTGAATSDWVTIQSVTVDPQEGMPDGLVGLWEFDDAGDLGKATYGTDLGVVGTAPAHAASFADGQASPVTLQGVITTAAGTDNHLAATHGIGGNGGGARVNEYTLVYDVLVPAGTAQWRCFYQTDPANGNDGEYFTRTSGTAANTLGRSAISYSSSPVPVDTWMRLVLSVDLGSSFTAYIDGSPFFSHNPLAVDHEEYALDPAGVLLFADQNDENAPLSIGLAAIYARALDAAESSALGGPGLALIPDPNNQLPLVAAQAAGPTDADTGVSETYGFVPSDPDGDDVQAQADWGDGDLSGWTALGTGGVTQSLAHAWAGPGTYTLRARARDARGGVSAWVDIQNVTVTGVPVVTFATPPYLQNVHTNGIVVMCETAEDVPLALDYGPDTGYGTNVPASRVASGGGTWFHRAVLTGLDAGTPYHYRFTSTAGDPLTADATFKTAPDGEADFTFSVWSDSQGHNGGAWSAEPLEPTVSMMQHMVAAGVDFGFTTGDLAENGSSYSDVRDYYLDRVARHLGTAVPWFSAWGNHEGSSINSPIRLASDMPSRYRPGYSPGHGSFSFTYANCFFVCIDHFYQGEIIDGWLEAQLASPEAQNARFRFLGIHVPPYCERWIDGSSTLRNNLVPLLETYNVDFCFSGHTHEYERGGLTGTNKDGQDHHVHYVISGGGSWLDHTEPVVMDWAHMFVGGAHNVTGTWARQSSPGVLGTPQPIVGGLFNEYALITVREDYLRLEAHGFNADGSVIGVLDSLEIGGPDPGPDTDGDGMRDPWEMANGLDHTSAAGDDGAEGDLDDDGQSNIAEMIAGTAANDPLSLLKVTGIGIDTGSGVPLTWSSVPGKRYGIGFATNLPFWSPLMDGGQEAVIDASGGATTSHLVPLGDPERSFLRVRIPAE